MSAAHSMWRGATLGNRLGLIRTLENSRPLAVRLIEGSTAGPAQYSEEPTSTWGYNPFHITNSPSEGKSTHRDLIAELTAPSNSCYRRLYIDCCRCMAAEAVLTTWIPTPKPIEKSMMWLAAVFGMLQTDSGCIAWIRPSDRNIGCRPKEERLQAAEVDLDDYFDPPTLEWNEDVYQAAKAVRTFSEDSHADH